ncbi:transcription initiation factor TFIID subunit 5 [Nematocida sp. AWRm80]|nr:transcription initiation factor TFIID subunit 5 [Nematocida sp. AWRm80]
MDREREERGVLDRRGFRRKGEKEGHGNVMSMSEYLTDKEMHSRLSVRNACLPDGTSSVDIGYSKLKQWIEDSLDAFKNDLNNLLFPIFVHLYLDMVSRNRVVDASYLMEQYKEDFTELHSNEIRQLEMVRDMSNIKENNVAIAFLSNKYHLSMGKYAFDLFISFLELNNMVRILKIVNQFLDIRVFTGKVTEETMDIGIAGSPKFDFNKSAVTTGVHYVSPKVEELIINEEQYKYDYLDQFMAVLKKKRLENTPPPPDRVPAPSPSASLIAAEIEKLKDLSKRVNIGKNQMPSICCYTVHNAPESLCSSDFSCDMKLLALGFAESYIEIHSLTEDSLLKLKQSIYLKMPEMRTGKPDDSRDDIGKVVRLVGHSGPVYAVKFFNSKRFLLSASQDNTIRLWSLDTYSELAVYRGHTFPVWCLDISPNDYYFISGSNDRTACVWTVENPKPVRLLASALSDVMSVKFHPNANYVFTGSSDFKIRMHDLQGGEMVRLFVGHTDVITTMDVSPCGKFLISGGKDKTAIIWDIGTGNKMFKLLGHDGFIYSVSFSFFAPLVVSSASDNTVKVWDRYKGELISTFYTKSTPIISCVFGHRNLIFCAGAYSPKGK